MGDIYRGNLEIQISVKKNEKVKGDYFEDYLLQATVTLDSEKCKNIQAEGATLANVGADKQILYNIMAGQEKEISITSEVTDFEMDGISFQGVPMSFAIDTDSLDMSALYEQTDELKEAVSQLDEGARQKEDEKLVTGLLYLDNYEEALNSVEEVRRSLLVALIERKLNKYFGEVDGLIKKLEKDKFILVMRQRSLEELKKKRFNILEDVKTVNIGNDMAVTISIGIGINAPSYSQNYEYARIAIDLALGRGGDQVVIKDREQMTYFGGKSQQMGKSTRVKARVKAHALREFMVSKDKVVVMGHKIPDVDSIGAAESLPLPEGPWMDHSQ